MYCYECGSKITDNSEFCENCGTRIQETKVSDKFRKLKGQIWNFYLLLKKDILKIKDVPPLKVLGTAFLFFVSIGLIFIASHFYESYRLTQETIIQTSKELRETQAKLSDIASSTSQKLAVQEQELSKKNNEIQKLQSSQGSGNVTGNLLASLSPSVVHIICAVNGYNDDLQAGSGVLYHSSDGNPANYFIETNLHVVQTDDGSPSQCIVAVYPNYANTSNYLVYQTSGYQIYEYGADFAYIFPKVSNSSHTGTINQLATYAKNKNSTTYCSSARIGDHISILGYPGVGGSSLTATDGIISGFESNSGVRYVKTSAKIEHGNSGGIAVKDSGCVVGIPTFVETGTVESIGRILDLYALFN